MELKTIPCPVCGSDRYIIRFSDTLQDRIPSFDYNFSRNRNCTYRLVRCLSCTHQYASPRPADIWSLYTGNRPDEIYLRNSEQRFATAVRVLRYLRKHKASGRLLDVGCATGDFLQAASRYYGAEGLEISEWSGKMAEQKGLRVHKRLLKDMDMQEHYDVITLWGVIEHFENPKDEVQHIFRLLKKGGIVALWTGDVSAVIPRLLGKSWWYYQGQHIQMFTRRSMRALFENHGFETAYMGLYPYVTTMHSLQNSLSRYPLFMRPAVYLLGMPLFKKARFTVRLSGEMFAIFRKV